MRLLDVAEGHGPHDEHLQDPDFHPEGKRLFGRSLARIDGQGLQRGRAMNRSPWIDPRINEVTVAGARTYLQSRGWHLQSYPRPELLVFEGPKDDNGEPIIQVLPSSERM